MFLLLWLKAPLKYLFYRLYERGLSNFAHLKILLFLLKNFYGFIIELFYLFLKIHQQHRHTND